MVFIVLVYVLFSSKDGTIGFDDVIDGQAVISWQKEIGICYTPFAVFDNQGWLLIQKWYTVGIEHLGD